MEQEGRALSTAILYLLPAGAKSKLHRLDAAEMWHAYKGAAQLSLLLPAPHSVLRLALLPRCAVLPQPAQLLPTPRQDPSALTSTKQWPTPRSQSRRGPSYNSGAG